MTDKIAKQEPNSAAAYFVCTFDNSRNQYYKSVGRDCVQNMLEQLRLLATRCVKQRQETLKWKWQRRISKNHRQATTCYFGSNFKVRGHCHRTGCYRGAAHNAWDTNYFSNRYLPSVFHNLRGYDSHSILEKTLVL
jgi:DNA/RNA endonuclease G (NUC1)